MISIEVHLDVPQYMAIPWLITWVIALTVSTKTAQISYITKFQQLSDKPKEAEKKNSYKMKKETRSKNKYKE